MDNHDSSSEEDEQPRFIRKSDRQTNLTCEKEVSNNENREIRLRTLVLEQVHSQNSTDLTIERGNSDVEIELLHSTEDNDLQFQAWKIRELNRLHRDTVERQIYFAERDNLTKRRSVGEDDGNDGAPSGHSVSQEDKVKWKFLQKYYHKGVFYMDSSSVRSQNDVRNKEYSEPTLEDKIDKEKLPSILRVKNFGKKGRTKYTHLVDQDTTLKENRRIAYKIDSSVKESLRNAKSRKH